MGNTPGKIIRKELNKDKPNYNTITENKNHLTKKEFDEIVKEEMNKYNTNLLKYLYETNQFNDLFYDYNRIMTMPLITFAIVNRLFIYDNSENKEFKEFLYAKSDINRTDHYYYEFKENSSTLEEKNRSLYNNNVKTPLMYVCESGIIKNIKEIINLKPNINYMNPNNITALHIACKKRGNEPDINKIIELLVDSGADVNIGEKTPFAVACEYRNLPIVKWMYEKGADVMKVNENNIENVSILNFIREVKEKILLNQNSQFRKIYTNGVFIKCSICLEKKENIFAKIECGNIICEDCVKKL